MTAQEIARYLRYLKEQKGWSSKHWSNMSGVPEATISRLLSASTESPYFFNVAALVKSIDGSLDELAGIERKPVVVEREKTIFAADVQELVNIQREAIGDLRKASRHERISSRVAWGITLFLFIVVFSVIVYDVMHTDVGWIRK